jgi:hypothetical protein
MHRRRLSTTKVTLKMPLRVRPYGPTPKGAADGRANGDAPAE